MKSSDERRAYQAAWKRKRLADPEARAVARQQNNASRQRHIESRRAADRAAYARDPAKRNHLTEAQRAQRNAAARARYNYRNSKDKELQRKYRITLEQYEALVDEKGGHCHCCGEHQGLLVPDHCHVSGVFRGVICGPCNRTIGHAKESKDRLRACIAWLDEH